MPAALGSPDCQQYSYGDAGMRTAEHPIGKPRQTAHAHAHCQILTLDIRRTDLAGVWIALDVPWDRFDNLSWAVMLPRFFVSRI